MTTDNLPKIPDSSEGASLSSSSSRGGGNQQNQRSRSSSSEGDGGTTNYKDYSQDRSTGTEDVRDSVQTFPMKLHVILSNPEFSNIISWLPHGRAWRIVDHKAFEEQVIPLYFRHGRYSSFARQVNGWSFKRIAHGPDYNSYYHELFLRGMSHLCEKMKRLTGKEAKKHEDEDAPVPDFYAMSRAHPLPEDPATKPTVAEATNDTGNGANLPNGGQQVPAPVANLSGAGGTPDIFNLLRQVQAQQQPNGAPQQQQPQQLGNLVSAVLEMRRAEILQRLNELATAGVTVSPPPTQQQPQQQLQAANLPALLALLGAQQQQGQPAVQQGQPAQQQQQLAQQQAAVAQQQQQQAAQVAQQQQNTGVNLLATLLQSQNQNGSAPGFPPNLANIAVAQQTAAPTAAALSNGNGTQNNGGIDIMALLQQQQQQTTASTPAAPLPQQLLQPGNNPLIQQLQMQILQQQQQQQAQQQQAQQAPQGTAPQASTNAGTVTASSSQASSNGANASSGGPNHQVQGGAPDLSTLLPLLQQQPQNANLSALLGWNGSGAKVDAPSS